MHLHILGICGTFMGGLAVIARQAGHRVTGCDANVYPPMSDQLRALGIELLEGYGADQSSLKPDLWVIGNVVTRGNPLMEAILDRGDRFVSGPQWLHDHLLFDKWVLAIAGTHGKTTTSAMLAWILEKTGTSPGYLIGGVPVDFAHSARLTASKFFVVEADEYDTAFFDKRSKFLHYPARTAVLNNLEYDHADIFPDLAAIERQFHNFVRIIPTTGRVIANGRDEALKRVLAQGCWTPVEYVGVPNGWETGPLANDGSYTIAWHGREMGRLQCSLQGEHNRMNVLSAIGAARHAGVEPAAAIEALRTFRGVKRRMELRGTARGVTVYDDFAHHPTAIRSTIEGLRQSAAPGRILVVLEPRSNSMKRGVMKAALPASLAGADLVYLYAAGLEWDIHSTFSEAKVSAYITGNLDDLVQRLACDARDGDRIVVMSNGGFGDIHRKLLLRLSDAR